MAWATEIQHSSGMLARRFEDRIRNLCAKVIAAHEDEVAPTISELKAALHEHNQRLRKLAAAKLTLREKPRTRPFR
jgi:hypothetical protein